MSCVSSVARARCSALLTEATLVSRSSATSEAPPEVNRDPAAWAAADGETHWATLATRQRRSGRAVQIFPSVEELLREMDAAGVERAVLLGWYWLKPESCALQNRFHAACVRAHPARLSAFATVHPSAGEVAMRAELSRARDEGLIGLGELSPHSQSYGINDRAFRVALTLAADWRWPVNVHVTCPDARAYPGHVPTPLGDFVRLAQDFPATTFIFAHWGGLLPLSGVRQRGAGVEKCLLRYRGFAAAL